MKHGVVDGLGLVEDLAQEHARQRVDIEVNLEDVLEFEDEGHELLGLVRVESHAVHGFFRRQEGRERLCALLEELLRVVSDFLLFLRGVFLFLLRLALIKVIKDGESRLLLGILSSASCGSRLTGILGQSQLLSLVLELDKKGLKIHVQVV